MISKLLLSGWRSTILVGMVASGTLVLNSCSSSPTASRAPSSAMVAQGSVAESKGDSGFADRAQPSASNKMTDVAPTAPATKAPLPQKPQLIKTAEMSIRLTSIDQALIQIRKIVQNQQGDIYNFTDDQPQDNRRRQASLVLKVPSAVLDDTLAAMSKLGKVQSQAIRSDDVTQQLVDTDARLKSLRQQEDMTRKIMERSGSIKDVLAVSQELATIRQQIEQLDASVKNLRQQVAYSTINLRIEEIQSSIPSSDPLGVQVQETWNNSTHAAGSLVTNLVLISLWLLPFTPFLAIGTGFFYFLRKRQQPQPTREVSNISEP